MKFLKALAITTVISLYGVINSTYAQAMTFEELYEIKTERLNAQSLTQGSPFALDDSDSQINAFLNLALINTYLSEEDHGGVFIDGDTLVVVEVVDPNNSARTNSMQRIHDLATTETRILSNFLRIEQGRFSQAELSLVSNYIFDLMKSEVLIDKLEPIIGERISVIPTSGSIVQENVFEVGIIPLVYNDGYLKNKVITYIAERVSNLSTKENFSDILIFAESAGIELLGGWEFLSEQEIWEYSEALELEEEFVLDNFNTITIHPGRTVLRGGSGTATANNLLNGRLLTTGHAFRYRDQVFIQNLLIGTVTGHELSGSVDASAITMPSPNIRVSNLWPDSSTISGNSGMFNVSGASITAFGSNQTGTGGRTGTIQRTDFNISLTVNGQSHSLNNIVLTNATGITEGDSGGPVRTAQGFNSGVIAGRMLDGTNRMVYVCIQRAMNVL